MLINRPSYACVVTGKKLSLFEQCDALIAYLMTDIWPVLRRIFAVACKEGLVVITVQKLVPLQLKCCCIQLCAGCFCWTRADSG